MLLKIRPNTFVYSFLSKYHEPAALTKIKLKAQALFLSYFLFYQLVQATVAAPLYR